MPHPTDPSPRIPSTLARESHPALPPAQPTQLSIWDRLLDALRGHKPRHQVLIIKTRACPLCEEATAELRRHRRSLGLTIATADITDHPKMMEIYGNHVPVVFVDDTLRFRGHVNPVLLRRAVRDD